MTIQRFLTLSQVMARIVGDVTEVARLVKGHERKLREVETVVEDAFEVGEQGR